MVTVWGMPTDRNNPGRPERLSVSGKLFVILAVSLMLGGCGILAKKKVKPLPGERISVMAQGAAYLADPEISKMPVITAPPTANPDWTQVGGGPTHTSYHLALAAAPRQLFRVGAGRGSAKEHRLLSQPVVDAKGRIYVMDAHARVTAFNGDTGKRIWRRDLRPKEERDGTLGAGLAVVDGKLFATTGFAQVLALDAERGDLLWRRKLSAPFRSAPTVSDGRVYAVSIDNRTHALDAGSGKVMWTHRGTAEQAALLGGASPAYHAGVLVVAYSSGEIFGLRSSTGRELWSDFLTKTRRTSAIATIADIRGAPIIDRGRVFVVNNAGQMLSLVLNTGVRIWQRKIAAINSPWVGGEFIYLLTTGNILVCLTRKDGRIRWSRSLPVYKDQKNLKGRISWSGPILAGDRLVLAGTNREVLAISPYSGDLLGQIRLSDGVGISPLVARNTLYVLTEDADLYAWR
ncbi:MAG: PQQ-binding-like beta-propeller repeat protein [Rhodospirillales bacterium]|jgi:outer membrane protein assembly factor BamB|nr:PQQ-binding-like beta-propeller repeat protein [Rhodospirillales bacterium]MBT4007540.1 PQQ-binding-like beta-propeller repeat protein [Rhodospirillales bacterium]MBT5076329.1 PQQ-binding-like beta-propeller repeat protein [Rhodospirillales bacterium]MBT5113254.1 PQQ-binding-like beta-propeller repeat protein [Rhodospirillales bacterium]MBT5671887.1 PQQ-binding-like beta-propeller repeat protein [Rhodospirillales bacterium]